MAVFYTPGQQKVRPGIYQRHVNIGLNPAVWPEETDPGPDTMDYTIVASDGDALVTHDVHTLIAKQSQEV